MLDSGGPQPPRAPEGRVTPVDAREIGRILRERREALGLSLQDVQAATKIRLRYLQALEAGETGVLPGAVYARGFVRSYANFLGLDGQELAEAYRRAVEPEAWSPPEPEPEPAPQPQPVPGQARAAWSRRAWLWVGALVAALVLWRPWAEVGSPPPPAAPGGPAAGSGTAPAPVHGGPPSAPTGEETPTPAPEEPGAPAQEPEQPAVTVTDDEPRDRIVYRVRAEQLDLVLTAADRCWVRVFVDGRFAYEGTLGPGDRRRFQADREIQVRAGNPRALALTLNGHALGSPAKEDPRTLVFALQP